MNYSSYAVFDKNTVFDKNRLTTSNRKMSEKTHISSSIARMILRKDKKVITCCVSGKKYGVLEVQEDHIIPKNSFRKGLIANSNECFIAGNFHNKKTYYESCHKLKNKEYIKIVKNEYKNKKTQDVFYKFLELVGRCPKELLKQHPRNVIRKVITECCLHYGMSANEAIKTIAKLDGRFRLHKNEVKLLKLSLNKITAVA